MLQQLNKIAAPTGREIRQGMFAQGWAQRLWREFCKTVLVQGSFRSFVEPVVRQFSPGYLAGFQRAKVLSVQMIAQGYVVRLKPRGDLTMLPGQHVQLRVEVAGRFVDRFFTIASSQQLLQHEGIIELAIRHKPQGQISQWLRSGITPGTTVWLGDVAGDFQLQQDRPAWLLAAGSGITPFRAMLQSLSRLTQPVHLIYVVSQLDQAWFSQEWAELSRKFPLLTVDIWATQQRGRPDLEQIAQQVAAMQADLYVCGPNALRQQLIQALAALPHWQGKLFSETFGGSSSGDTQAVEFITRAGQTIHTSGQGSLLQLAEQQGVNAKFGCRRGVCMQCVCQKQQGQVRNQLTGELSSFGPELVQLCVSEAVTPVTIQLSV